jgi:hypothetical protein
VHVSGVPGALWQPWCGHPVGWVQFFFFFAAPTLFPCSPRFLCPSRCVSCGSYRPAAGNNGYTFIWDMRLAGCGMPDVRAASAVARRGFVVEVERCAFRGLVGSVTLHVSLPAPASPFRSCPRRCRSCKCARICNNLLAHACVRDVGALASLPPCCCYRGSTYALPSCLDQRSRHRHRCLVLMHAPASWRRRGKCYHCGGDEHVRRNLCVNCRITSFTVTQADVIPGGAKASSLLDDGTHVTPRKASAKRAAESTSNPYLTSKGYRYCQGNCSTIPRPLSEFGVGESKKCLWCLSRQAGKASGVPRVPASPGTQAVAAPKSTRPRTPSVEFETINFLPADSSVKSGQRRPPGRPAHAKDRPPLSGIQTPSLGLAPMGLVVDTGVSSDVADAAPKSRTLKKAASFSVKRKRDLGGGGDAATGGSRPQVDCLPSLPEYSGDDGHPGLMPASEQGGTVCSTFSPNNANDSFSMDIRNALAGCAWTGFTNSGRTAPPDASAQGRRDSVVVPPLKRLMSMSVR